MAKVNYVFKRVEKKYLLTQKKYELLQKYISPYMEQDSYGLHTICNVYYDTDNYDLIRESLEKPDYKEKLRLRSYGTVGRKDTVFVELKKKYKGVVYKRRISLTLEEAECYLNNNIKPKKESQISKEIDYFMKLYNPKTKAYIAYDRVAYFGKEDKDISINIDKNIIGRQYDLSLEKGDYGDYLLGRLECLMEIKVSGAMPLWLSSILSELKIYPVSFSKYGVMYKECILNKGSEELCLQAY